MGGKRDRGEGEIIKDEEDMVKSGGEVSVFIPLDQRLAAAGIFPVR
jgi:hypothetical protein